MTFHLSKQVPDCRSRIKDFLMGIVEKSHHEGTWIKSGEYFVAIFANRLHPTLFPIL
jgi:hypothetical protein